VPGGAARPSMEEGGSKHRSRRSTRAATFCRSTGVRAEARTADRVGESG
jgi:hypothetical protein